MAVIKKTLFPKNLDKYAVLVNDTQSDSKYFKITELPDTFTGGKNSFLIAGSEYLVPDTKIQIELKDAAGNIIYHEPGEGLISSSINGETFVSEYYEGVSKVVAVYVYPDTAYGPCTLTILGELSEYEDTNGITFPVPLDWENKYNVKWQKQIDVNPSLANTTKIRFYQRPQATITELLSPLYTIENDVKVASNVTQSFADIKLSRLETFAGDVKRVKVFRTSQGDISDYDLIQDILIEAKELLTSYDLSGSVVGNTGIFTQETLTNYWNTGSLSTQLTSSRVESGLKLSGSGYLTYSQSLDIKSANTYELNLDAFYSSSISSNLGIYLSYQSGSNTFSSSIGTLYGLQPTTNLLDQTFAFKLNSDYPTASLFLSQSRGEWHVGNISLKLSQDTAFSPDEVSFVTTMPTVLGNETYNFKFEFYDVNNNYVPVAVTQSALFTGGNNNIGGTLTLISSSTSQSLAELYAVSSSISGTVTFNSSSVSGSITTLSGSVSASITSLSSSVSSSNSLILSSSLSKVQQLANGQYSGSFIGDTVIYSPTIGGQQGYISKLFTVGDTSAARINLDARNTTDGAPDNLRRVWIGTQTYGYHNNSNTPVYLDSDGKFSLGNKLNWSGTALSITGEVVITSGTTYDAITTAQSTANTAQSTANTANTNATTALGRVVSAAGAITFDPAPSGTGLFLNAQKLGFYDAGTWKTYMTNTGNFYLAGSGDNGLSWNGSTLTIDGAITARTGYIGSGTSGFTINSTYFRNGTKTSYNGAGTGVYVGTDGIGLGTAFYVSSGGALTATSATVTGTITATSITANTAGSIAGWNIDSNRFYKSVSGTGTIEIKSSDNTISMYDTNGNLRLQLNPTTTLPTLTTPGSSTTIYANDGVGANAVGPGTNVSSTIDKTNVGITLSSANNEIYVYFDDTRWFDPNSTPEVNAAYAFTNPSLNTLIDGQYSLQVVLTGGSISGELVQTIGFVRTSIDSGGTYTAASLYTSPALFGNLPAGSYNLKVRHYFFANKILGGTINWYRWAQGWGETDGISVLYGSSNAYSVLNAGGMVLSQGSQNYMQVKSPTTGTDSFFAVRGKSTFLNGLFVSGSLAANSKQFQITHPLDENKWLYHTAIESPRADLIYRGTLELENGSGSVSIDSASRMQDGTFESLTKNRQLFLQNNNTFDRIKGHVENGSVFIFSENSNVNTNVDWMVVAERNDITILSSKLYDENGNYKPERYKDYLFQQNLETTGSI